MLPGRWILVVSPERVGTSVAAHDLVERTLASGEKPDDIDLVDSIDAAAVKQRRRPVRSTLAFSFGSVIGLDRLIKLVVVSPLLDGGVALDAPDVHRVNVATVTAITTAALQEVLADVLPTRVCLVVLRRRCPPPLLSLRVLV